jgi:hypothetical protein
MLQARTTYIPISCHMCVYVTGQDDLHSNVMSHVCMSQARTTYIPMACHMCVYVTGQYDLPSNVMSHVCMSKARRTYISMSCHVCMSQARTTYIAMSYIAVCVFNFLSLSFVDVGGIDDNHCLNFLFISLSYMYQQHP